MKRACTFGGRLILILALAGIARTGAQELQLPNGKDSVRFAVIGDAGTGDRAQYAVAEQLAKFRGVFPFQFVLMLGDNLYGGERPKDFARKFERPYEALLTEGVKFYAALGNHDNPNQSSYKNFNMNGKRYYTFRPRSGVRFFALDSNYPSKEQLEWLERELAGSGSEWKIMFFHHPLYSSGEKHGPSDELRNVLEPLFVKHGVSVVLAGHEHFYERIKPQKGITHFILGNSAKLRKGDLRRTDITAKGFDTGYAFMLCEIEGDTFHFQTITSKGQTVDRGTVERLKTQDKAGAAMLRPVPAMATAR